MRTVNIVLKYLTNVLAEGQLRIRPLSHPPLSYLPAVGSATPNWFDDWFGQQLLHLEVAANDPRESMQHSLRLHLTVSEQPLAEASVLIPPGLTFQRVVAGDIPNGGLFIWQNSLYRVVSGLVDNMKVIQVASGWTQNPYDRWQYGEYSEETFQPDCHVWELIYIPI